MSPDESINTTDQNDIENLVPSRKAYFLAFVSLFFSGIAGGLIGYAMMEVFFPDASKIMLFIGTCLICVSIIYGVSIITSLGLQASVEWKARKADVPSRNRPSRLIAKNEVD